MQLADRLNRIEEPQTIRMAKLARELRQQGADIIDLSLGEPDFPTPPHIVEAAYQAMLAGYTKYPPVAGVAELREAICTKLKRDNKLDYKPENIIVSTGAKQSLANAVLSLINPGDEVVIPTPYWVTYAALVQLAEGRNVFINAPLEQNFKITPEQLEAAITPRTRLFIFSSPCNPTGSVYSHEELAGLAAVFARHPQVSILSDEIYEYINYTGPHASIAAFDEIKDRVVVVNGFSKGFSMTGWRLGYMAARKELVAACDKLQAQFTSGANTIAQHAAITALNASLEPTHAMTRAFRERRDMVIAALKDMPGMQANTPEGAFYAFPDVSAFFGAVAKDGSIIRNDEDLSMYLLHHAHVSSVNGASFGDDQCIRLSFANSMDNLRMAMSRIGNALAELKMPSA